MRERVEQALVWAAMVTPPWNLFWWGVGLTLYQIGGGTKTDYSGDGAIAVFGAPVALPCLLWEAVREKLKR